jgi:hypothetical protein
VIAPAGVAPNTQIDKHSVDLEKFDVEGVLAFAERVLPRASDLWVQASLNQKQRLQQLFLGEGVAFDGKQFVRTAVTANSFNYLTAPEISQNEVASPMPASWNQIAGWLNQIDNLRQAA